jgi:hypothetical protein
LVVSPGRVEIGSVDHRKEQLPLCDIHRWAHKTSRMTSDAEAESFQQFSSASHFIDLASQVHISKAR